jgi:mannose-6-phosphate isomerase-like protein (cupin superfamily)
LASSARSGPAEKLSHRGDVVVNRLTGERAVVLVGTGDGRGDRLAAHVFLQPAVRLVAPHYHPSLVERFRVLKGRLGVLLDGREQTLDPGADVTIPPRTVHDFWNVADGVTEVLVDVRPGRRFELMIGTLFGLANDGKTNEKGMPGPLQLAAIAHEFRDIVRFTKPPEAIQRVVFRPLTWIARARGYRGWYPQYVGAHGHEAPDPEALALVDEGSGAPAG